MAGCSPAPGAEAQLAHCHTGCSLLAPQALLAKQRCLVVGSGGVGSCIGLTLARIGVEHITFVDMDTVAASNLNR